MLLPGESISKYNRAEVKPRHRLLLAESGGAKSRTVAMAAAVTRCGDRDRGGRGRRGDRDRDRGRRPRREPREREPDSVALPENYTPIVLPGESISKYRGVEPSTLGAFRSRYPELSRLLRRSKLADGHRTGRTESSHGL